MRIKTGDVFRDNKNNRFLKVLRATPRAIIALQRVAATKGRYQDAEVKIPRPDFKRFAAA